MNTLANPLLLEDYSNTNWQDAIATASRRSCWDYYVLFYKMAESCESTGDAKGQQVFLRLALWTQPRMSGEPEPFPEAFLASISQEDYAVLRELARATADPEMRARLADLAWQGRINNKRDPSMARLAIASYLEASDLIPDQWREQVSRIERALNLALGLGRGASQERDDVWDYIESRLAAIDGDDDWFLSARLMELLQEHQRGAATLYAPMAERAAVRAEALRGVGQWAKARRYWTVKAGWHEAGSEDWFAALEHVAETHVQEAEDELEGFYGRKEPIAGAHHLQCNRQDLI